MRRLAILCAPVTSAALALALAPAAFADTVQVDTTVDEDDLVPNANCSLREATYTVNSGSGVGGCTLQTAAGADTITFDPVIFQAGAPVETIDLTAFGQLLIDTADDNAVEIQGPGSGELIITNTNPTDRIIELSDAAEAHTISGLEISGGDQVDPGTQRGAGILASAALSLDDVELRDNRVAPLGISSGGTAAEGGGIWSENALTIQNSVIEDNTASAVNADDGVDIVAATGGGIWHDVGAPLTIANSSVSGNDVVADDTSDGASFNEAIGAGIFASSTVTVTQTTLSGNTATAGSTAAAATAKGAGIRLGGLDSRIELSTIEGNAAAASGPGPTIRGAGVMVIDAPNMPLVSSTIASNGDATDVDTEGANLFAEGAGGVAVANTIVASPVGATGATSNCFEDTTGNIDSNGFNVEFYPGSTTSSCNFTQATDLPDPSDVTGGTDPDLNALADNGGTGPTMLPDVGSPVIDQGDASEQDEDLDSEDQRGLPRPALFDDISNAPLGDGSDIGATEIPIAPPSFDSTDPASPNDDDTPNVLGTVAVYSPVTAPIVQLFTNPACTVASGAPTSAGDFFDPGIATGPLPHSATTTFYGKVETDYGVSHCSTGLFPNTISYTNTLVDPVPPVVSPPPVTTTPAPAKKKKCKKGFVRKKGKCVRKKRKKKKG